MFANSYEYIAAGKGIARTVGIPAVRQKAATAAAPRSEPRSDFKHGVTPSIRRVRNYPSRREHMDRHVLKLLASNKLAIATCSNPL